MYAHIILIDMRRIAYIRMNGAKDNLVLLIFIFNSKSKQLK